MFLTKSLWLIDYVDDSDQRQIRDFNYMMKSHMIEMTKSLYSSAISEDDSDRDNEFIRISSVCSLWDIKSDVKEIIYVDDVNVIDIFKDEALKALFCIINIQKDKFMWFN